MRICDFVFGFAKFRSILCGVCAVIAGLPLSAIVVFTVLETSDWKDKQPSDDSDGQH